MYFLFKPRHEHSVEPSSALELPPHDVQLVDASVALKVCSGQMVQSVAAVA